MEILITPYAVPPTLYAIPLSPANKLHDLDPRPIPNSSGLPIRLPYDAPVELHRHSIGLDPQNREEAPHVPAARNQPLLTVHYNFNPFCFKLRHPNPSRTV